MVVLTWWKNTPIRSSKTSARGFKASLWWHWRAAILWILGTLRCGWIPFLPARPTSKLRFEALGCLRLTELHQCFDALLKGGRYLSLVFFVLYRISDYCL